MYTIKATERATGYEFNASTEYASHYVASLVAELIAEDSRVVNVRIVTL